MKLLARVPLVLVRSPSGLRSSRAFGRSFRTEFLILNETKLTEYRLVQIVTKATAMKKKRKIKKISLWENKITTYNYSVLSRYNKNIRCNIWTYISVLALSAKLEFLTH